MTSRITDCAAEEPTGWILLQPIHKMRGRAADLLCPRSVERMVEVWIDTEFEGGRHSRRVEKIHEIEKKFKS